MTFVTWRCSSTSAFNTDAFFQSQMLVTLDFCLMGYTESIKCENRCFFMTFTISDVAGKITNPSPTHFYKGHTITDISTAHIKISFTLKCREYKLVKTLTKLKRKLLFCLNFMS
jgi:hypothetical protein